MVKNKFFSLLWKLGFHIARRLNGSKYRKYNVRGYEIYLNISESLMMLKRALGRYEPEKFSAIENVVNNGMTFLDVGANKGDFSFFAGNMVGPSGKVIAFEPEPGNCNWIKKSIQKNPLSNISLIEIALSNKDEERDLYLGEKSGWHSIVEGAKNRGEGKISVHTQKLDSIFDSLNLSSVDAMKIDVEGAEYDVISGGQKTIEKFRPIIFMDLHPELGVDVSKIFEFFNRRKFVISSINHPESYLEKLEPVPQEIIIQPLKI
jgi:FkbM family methyltransferase